MEASVGQQGGGTLQQWWNEQPGNLRILWLLLAAVLLALTFFLAARANTPEFVTMYSGLSDGDTTAIARVLEGQNIEFRISAGGDAILVPSTARDAARLAVASEGVMPSGPKGYEILDNPSPFALSDFNQKINLQRAREGELARTLMGLEAVRDARVLLTIPEDSPFLTERGAPGASVALTLRGGASLAPGDADTIANLVAAAVSGLSPANVVIMDQNANLLAGPATAGRPTDSEGRGLTEAFEDRLQAKVQKLLEPTFGAANVRVAITADLDLDQVLQSKETFEPESSGKGIPRSEQTREQSSTGQALSEEGLAGTVSNIPSYPSAPEGAAPSNSRLSDTITNYEISSVKEEIQKAPGAVKRLSVSVVLDLPALAPEVGLQVEGLIKGAINYDQVRGDVVTVAAIPFSTEMEEQLQADATEARKAVQLDRAVQIAGWVILIGLFGWATLMLLRFLGTQIGFRTAATPEGGRLNLELEPQPPELSPEDRAKQRLRDEILAVTRNKPEEAAKVIKSWLKE